MYFPKERATRRRRPFCFVTFDSHQAAERAVAESNRVIEVPPTAPIPLFSMAWDIRRMRVCLI